MKENSSQPNFFTLTESEMLINAPVGIFISTPQGRFDSVNPALARMLGYETPQELVKSVTDISMEVYADPADRKKLIELLKLHGQVTNYECRFVNRDGHILWVILNAFAVFNSNDELTQIQGYITDISAREYAQKMLQNKTEVLNERIKELQCIYQISDLYQKESSLQDFISKTADLIPTGLKYPESACAMIVFEGQTYKSEPFIETSWSMTREIKIHGKDSGSINVFYMEEKPEADHGPFLNEELDLLKTLADLLGKAIERNHFEKDLREKESLFRTLVDTVGEGIMLQDASGKILHYNKTAAEMFGIDPDQAVVHTSTSRDWYTMHEDGTIFPGEDHPSMHTLRTGEPCTGVIMGVKRDLLETAWIKINTRALFKPGESMPYAVVVSFSDITAQKQTEESLRKSEKQFRTMFMESPVSIIVHDKDSGEIIDANPMAYTTYGLSSLEEMKSSDLWLDPPYSFQDALSWIRKAADQGPQKFEWLSCRKNKDLFWEWVSLSTLEIGGVKRVLATSFDITERKQAEEKIRHLNAVLQAIRNVNQLITQEKDRDKLLTKSCLSLVETRGYYNAWIALLDRDYNLDSFYSAGLGDKAGLMESHLENKLPLNCLKEIMEGQNALVIDDPYASCTSCPMKAMYKDRSGLCGRLEFDGIFFGILTISTLNNTAYGQEELSLFEELLGDISYALHTLEKENERRKAEEELHRKDVMLRIAGDLAKLGGWSVDLSENRVYWSDQVAKIHEMPLGYSPTLEEGINFYAPEYRKRITKIFRDCVNKGTPYDEEMQIITGKGRKVWVKTIGVAEKDDAGRIIRVQGGFQDITEQKLADKKLKESEIFQRALVDCSPLPIFSLDPDGKVLTWNKAAEKVFGWKSCEVIGRPLPIVSSDKQDEFKSLRNRLMSGHSFTGKELVRQKKNGELITISLSAAPVHDTSGRITGIIATVEDITERKKAVDRLKYLSLHDQLTGLYNRTYLENEMHRLNQSREYPVAIISIDVDGLKLVNDSLGHEYGDRLLKLTSEILQKSLRKSDIMARFGGDEFVALLPRTNIQSGRKILSRVRELITDYNSQKEEKQLPLNVSIGLAVALDEKSDLFAVFKEADDLMYRDKLSKEETARSQIMRALLTALDERDFVTSGHVQRLEDLCLLIGERVGLSERQLSNLALLTQVHDLGKVGIPDHILFKPGPLTEEEWKIMRKHPEKGYRIAQASMDLTEIADLILKHHERWDGKGYPLGLKGKNIPVECRVLGIVDAYDAMINDRPYRKALSPEEAVQEIKKCSGTQFDPELVEVFLDVL